MKLETVIHGDRQFIDRLSRAKIHYRVHSAFSRAVNLLEEGTARMYTFVSGADWAAPDSLNFTGSLDVLLLEAGDRLEWDGSSFRCDGRPVATCPRSARRIDLALPTFDPRASFSPWQPLLLEQAIRSGNGPFSTATGPESAVDATMRKKLSGLARDFRQAVEKRDRREAVRHGSALIGLGPGLTPSGDDFLMGFLSVLRMPAHPYGDMADIGQPILKQAGAGTTEISLALLENAARGRIMTPVAALLEAGQEPAGFQRRLARLLAHGSSSGTDIAHGLLEASHLTLEI